MPQLRRLTQFKSQILRKDQNQARKDLMQCVLRNLSLVFISAFAACVLVRTNSVGSLKDHTWIPFAFIGLTIAWVVVSRVVNSEMRLILFIAWCIGLVASAAHGASSDAIGPATIAVCASMAISYACVWFVTHSVNMSYMFAGFVGYTFIAATATAAVLTFMPHLEFMGSDIPGWKDKKILGVAVTGVAVFGFQIWNTWVYLGEQKHLKSVKDTCLYAFMSPWSTTVDNFAVLSSQKSIFKR